MATDERQTASEPARTGGHRVRVAVTIALVALLLDSAYLFIANRASGPPRIALAAFTYEGTLLLHLLLGTLAAIYAAATWRRAIERLRALPRRSAALFGLTRLSLAVCLLSGLAFVGIGFAIVPLDLRYVFRPIHDGATLGFLLFGLAYLGVQARRAGDSESPDGGAQFRTAARLGLLFGVPCLALLIYTVSTVNADRVIANPLLPPMTAFQEGDGQGGKFFPASAQSVGGQFFPSTYFMDSKSCGVPGCHPEIYKEWEESAHHHASFNNQWYRKAIEYMQNVIGTYPSKWCGGCHDMAVLLTEDPHKPGQSRFDKPIRQQVWPPETYPESHAGIGCAVCHSIVHVKSTMGNNDYLADYPPMHRYMDTSNPFARALHAFLTRLGPEPHKKTFLRPFHVDSTAKFCSACHKVHLDFPVNGYRWFRGFDEYDSWQGSGVSGLGAASFYYPSDPKTGQPAFKSCADCHMPEVASHDAGNVDGFIHSHRFPAANTALPYVLHEKAQMEVVQKFLTNKALTIDIFAIRRAKNGPASIAASASRHSSAVPQETPQAANLNGEASMAALSIEAANVATGAETLTAPLNRGGPGAAFRRGEAPLVDVVVRTRGPGHAFPGGTFDAFDVWVELEAQDSRGRVFYHSGELQWPNGPVEDGAERYRTLQVDGHGNEINKRNAWAARAVVYAKAIPPGADDAVHFRIPIPKDCSDRVTLTARLNYRKFGWWNTAYAFLGRFPGEPRVLNASTAADFPTAVGIGKKSGPVTRSWDDRPIRFDADSSTDSGDFKVMPDIPITVLAQDTVTLPVVGPHDPLASPAVAPDAIKDRERWNDYGIGLLLQGDFRHATNAFEQVIRLAPQWPEGYVNLGRVRQAERDTRAAKAALDKALALYDAHPAPMTPYLRARTQFFYAQALFDLGQLDSSLAMLDQVMKVFPDDRNVRNQAGTTLFRLGRYDDAIAQLQHTLSIDPEDIVAHYNLMKCYRGKGDMAQAAIHEQLYKRFKADETTTYLTGIYRARHPADNNLAQLIHEHGDAIIHPKPAWYVAYESALALREQRTRIAALTHVGASRQPRRPRGDISGAAAPRQMASAR